MKIDTNKTAIDEILERSVSEVLPSKEALKKRLLSGDRLKIYIGVDATGSRLHLGNGTNFILLEKLRKLGHEIIILFGDYTAMIGDPSDKNSVRKRLSKEEVEENIKDWRDQVSKLVDFEDKDNPAKIMRNSEWLSKLTLNEVIDIASDVTVQQMLERSMFKKRLSDNKPIYLHEFIYPLLQGYDSVAMDVDVEVGGTDQTFNMLVGRTLQKRYNNREKFVLSTTILENPKTGEKLMNKSYGTFIALNDNPTEMFGKVMSLPDETIVQMFTDTTDISMEDILNIKKALESGENPKEYKVLLGKEIVSIYHGSEEAEKTAINFEKTFSQGLEPENVQETNFSKGELLSEILIREGLVKSKSDFRRLVDEGAIVIDGDKIDDHRYKVEKKSLIKIGKHRFLKLK